MKKLILFLLAMVIGLVIVRGARAQDTPHYKVVGEYIRSLAAIHRIQQTAEKELSECKNDRGQTMMTAIRNSTRVKLELNTSISILKGMKLKEPFEILLPTTIEWYERKIQLHDEVIMTSKMFLEAPPANPKPGVDYSKMSARVAEITATLEYVDESLFQMMTMVCFLLIDEKPDSQGHMSHLNITKAQKQTFLDDINILFGESLNKQNKNWTVASAVLLKDFLSKKGYKCIEEW